MTGTPPFDGVVLAGGAAARFGGDKLAAPVGGRALLTRVLDALADAEQVVLVGPRRLLPRAVVWTQERPPGGGPAAALGAALPLLHAEWTVLLAGDLPFLRAEHVHRLLAAARDGDGAVAVDPSGRAQWLTSAWRTAALPAGALGPGRSLRGALEALRPAPVTLPPEPHPAWFDCDTPADLAEARRRA